MKSEKYIVISSYDSPYPDSIPFAIGEEVGVGTKYEDDPDWKDWYWCEANGEKEAWIPGQYLDIQGEKGTLNTGYDARELGIQAGEVVIVHKIVNGFGWAENSSGETAWAPLKYLKNV